jgi:hypothetical protein
VESGEWGSAGSGSGSPPIAAAKPIAKKFDPSSYVPAIAVQVRGVMAIALKTRLTERY